MGGRQTISRDVLERVVGLLREGISVSQTAIRLNLGESVVRRIGHGRHVLQRPAPKKPKARNWRNQYTKIPDPTPEEIATACREFQAGWTETTERRHRVTKPVPYTFQVVKESWLLGE